MGWVLGACAQEFQFPLAHLTATYLQRNTDMLKCLAEVITNEYAV